MRELIGAAQDWFSVSPPTEGIDWEAKRSADAQLDRQLARNRVSPHQSAAPQEQLAPYCRD
jgi:hypothetical protein